MFTSYRHATVPIGLMTPILYLLPERSTIDPRHRHIQREDIERYSVIPDRPPRFAS